MLSTPTKEPFDLTIAFIVVVTWFRFFNFFLLVPRLARLVVTIYQILLDTMTIIFLLILVFIISITAFTTRFYQIDPRFESFWHTGRYLFGCMVG